MDSPRTINRDFFNYVMERIQKSCVKYGRKAEEIQIVAVTKTFGIEAITSALDLGIKCIGENKVQETEKKIPLIKNRKKAEIHFIGHVQSNKVRKVLKHIDVIETIDSIKIAKRINQISQELNIITPIYLQINTENDPNKYGFNTKNIFTSAEEINSMKNLLLSGIMTIPPLLSEKFFLNSIFKKTNEIQNTIRNQINKNCINLSMGMSRDYEIAIKNNATHIRLGAALFGNRN